MNNGSRRAVQGEFAEGDPLVLTLPRLSPTPGATPDPVEALAVWDAESGQAVITWTASANPNLDHHEVRYGPGTNYDADTETVVASVRADEARGSRIVMVARPEGTPGTAQDRALAGTERVGSAAADVLHG